MPCVLGRIAKGLLPLHPSRASLTTRTSSYSIVRATVTKRQKSCLAATEHFQSFASAIANPLRGKPDRINPSKTPTRLIYGFGQWRSSFSTAAAASAESAKATTIYPLSSNRQPIRILYASQGGTAQIFANQLAEALEDYYYNEQAKNGAGDGEDGVPEISIQGWHEHPRKKPDQLVTPGQGLHVFLASVTGVGEPPDNGRAFYDWIQQKNANDNPSLLQDLEYTVFGLGNSKAHPNHFNVVGLGLDQRLEELGGKRVHPLGLGDDGDCIEDDFDKWMEDFMSKFAAKNSNTETITEDESPAEVDPEVLCETEVGEGQAELDDLPRVSCPPGVAKSPNNTRIISSKHPTLQLFPRHHDYVCHDLFHLKGTPKNIFYAENTVKAQVIESRSLSAYGGEAGLREVAVTTTGGKKEGNISYETGDHCLVYPRNSGCVVEAYLNILDVDPHATIEGTLKGAAGETTYPYPEGLSVYETLSHCVDLGAPPSPAFARLLLGRRELDYKQEIAIPRRTVLDLLLEKPPAQQQQPAISLEDLLYNLVPMKPRYYSIASSSTASPDQVLITFRPVKYMTNRGHLREGVCTNYMSTMGAATAGQKESSIKDDNIDNSMQYMPVCITTNPTFRLPEDPETPVLLIAGGCGVAPIRAFVEERLTMARQNPDAAQKFGPGLLYLGFRSPEDEAYRSLVDQALAAGALTDAKVAYSHGCTTDSQYCMNVNELVRHESQLVWEHMESGGVTYLCGGARTFGAAIEQELLEIIQEHGQMDFAHAERYMRNLMETGRLLEDLAD